MDHLTTTGQDVHKVGHIGMVLITLYLLLNELHRVALLLQRVLKRAHALTDGDEFCPQLLQRLWGVLLDGTVVQVCLVDRRAATHTAHPSDHRHR